jgi:hypothetical protein
MAGLESPGPPSSCQRWRAVTKEADCPLAFEGDRQIRLFRGDVTDYEAFRRKELGTAADQPHRIRYKRLAAA